MTDEKSNKMNGKNNKKTYREKINGKEMKMELEKGKTKRKKMTKRKLDVN